MPAINWSAALVALALVIPAYHIQRQFKCLLRRRSRQLEYAEERVLVLGAASGVGREVAKQYAARGARVCVVARRADAISALAEECGNRCIWRVADFSKAGDMVELRDMLQKEWQGLDTLHICAGVSALQPIMALTGAPSGEDDATCSGIETAVDIAGRAMRGNFDGPLVSALTFVSQMWLTCRARSTDQIC
jgi:NAD(P)-dependent dehydrogenase (short-subunit alcohol dehydrogenase family)